METEFELLCGKTKTKGGLSCVKIIEYQMLKQSDGDARVQLAGNAEIDVTRMQRAREMNS